MSDKQESKSFWGTLPGILTGCAALLTAIGGVITALYAAGLLPSAPATPTPATLNKPSASAPAAQKAMYLSIVAVPQTPGVGQQSTIYVTVRDQNKLVVDGVRVLVEAGGGKFLQSASTPYDPKANLQGPFTASGYTDLSGVYTAWWVCNPCAPGYEMNVRASKDGYAEASGKITISMK